jgi:hypothetical protein
MKDNSIRRGVALVIGCIAHEVVELMKIWITGLSFSKNINEETVALCIHFIVLT